jgi:hypothetical protein
MTDGWKRTKRGWISGDPPGSEKPRGKSAYRRKGSRDGGAFTPSEQRQKDALMRQFLKRDGQQGNTKAYCKGYDAMVDPKTGRMRP